MVEFDVYQAMRDQLGVEYYSSLFEAVASQFAPALGWKPSFARSGTTVS
ncbi:hypothetical protein [Rathayibacter tritici]|nr:hypothetical protein [Rathayibacter tritici]